MLHRNIEVIHIAAMAFKSNDFSLSVGSNSGHTEQQDKNLFHVLKL